VLIAVLIVGLYGRTATFGYVELDDTLLIVEEQPFLLEEAELNPQNLNAYASLVRYFLSRNEMERAAPYIERLNSLGAYVRSRPESRQ